MESKNIKIYAVIGPSSSGKSRLIGKLISKSKYKNGLSPVQENRLYNARIRGDDSEKGILFTQFYENQLGCTIVPTENIFEYDNSNFSLIDTPGNFKYLKNLIRGISYIDNIIILFSLQNYRFDEIREFLLISIGMDVKSIIIAIDFSQTDKCIIDEYKRTCFDINQFYLSIAHFMHANFKLSFIPINILEEDNIFNICKKFSSLNNENSLIDLMCQNYQDIDKINIDEPTKLLVFDKLNSSEGIIIVKIARGTLQISDELYTDKIKNKVKNIEKEYTKLKIVNRLSLPSGSIVSICFNDKINTKIIRRGEFLYDARINLPKKPKKLVTSAYILKNKELKIQAKYTIILNSGTAEVFIENIEEVISSQNKIITLIFSKNYGNYNKQNITCIEEFNNYSKHGKFILRENRISIAIGTIEKILYS